MPRKIPDSTALRPAVRMTVMVMEPPPACWNVTQAPWLKSLLSSAVWPLTVIVSRRRWVPVDRVEVEVAAVGLPKLRCTVSRWSRSRWPPCGSTRQGSATLVHLSYWVDSHTYRLACPTLSDAFGTSAVSLPLNAARSYPDPPYAPTQLPCGELETAAVADSAVVANATRAVSTPKMTKNRLIARSLALAPLPCARDECIGTRHHRVSSRNLSPLSPGLENEGMTQLTVYVMRGSVLAIAAANAAKHQ